MQYFFQKIPTAIYLSFFALVFLLQVYLVRETVMGDAFIHFVFARGIAGGEWFFYNGSFSAGSTAPLWSMILAPIWYLFGNGIILFAKVLAASFGVISIGLVFVLVRKILASRAMALIASALWAGNFLLAFWAAKGMETPFFTCLVLLAFLLFLLIQARKKWIMGEILLGIILGLGILTRPEMWALSAILGISLLWRKNFRAILTVAFPAFIIFLPYYFYLWIQTDQVFPSSLARIYHARQFAQHNFGIFWSPEIFKILLTKYLPLTPFFLFYFFIHPKFSRQIFFLIIAWLVFHLGFFTFIFPSTNGQRYILAAIPFFILIALAGLQSWRQCKIFRFKIHPKVFQIVLLVAVVGGSFLISGIQLSRRVEQIHSCEKQIDFVRRSAGEWLAKNTSIDSLIAVKEVDQTAYFSGRKVLSMDGTLDLRALPFIATKDQLGFLRQYRPDFLILEEEMYGEYPDWQKSNLQKLIQANLSIGQTKKIDGIQFTLLQQMKVGDAKICRHFSREYFWKFFALQDESKL